VTLDLNISDTLELKSTHNSLSSNKTRVNIVLKNRTLVLVLEVVDVLDELECSS